MYKAPDIQWIFSNWPSFHLLCFTLLLTCNCELNVPCTSDLGDSDVLKIHFILSKEALVWKIQKEVGIHKHHADSAVLWNRTFQEFKTLGRFLFLDLEFLRVYLPDWDF